MLNADYLRGQANLAKMLVARRSEPRQLVVPNGQSSGRVYCARYNRCCPNRHSSGLNCRRRVNRDLCSVR